MSWTYYWAAGGSSAQPAYSQFEYGRCLVGCGPTAWAMLFCWADRQAATGNTYWAGRTGLYRFNGGRGEDAVAPHLQDGGVENVIKELHEQCDTWCAFGSGATSPWKMPGAFEYLDGRTAAEARASWNPSAIAQDDLRDRVIESIVNRRTPAIVGIGWFDHYPLAWGYAWQKRTIRRGTILHSWDDVVTDRSFYLNEGWGQGGSGDWVEASTWFAGQLWP
jgi:hypothetical protein